MQLAISGLLFLGVGRERLRHPTALALSTDVVPFSAIRFVTEHGLRERLYHELDADRPDAHDRYGVCFADGRIRVRLIHANTGRPLRYSALIDTVVHELAHLRHMNHGPYWAALYEKRLAWCRTQGIYAPQQRREPPAEPAQLGLFGRE